MQLFVKGIRENCAAMEVWARIKWWKHNMELSMQQLELNGCPHGWKLRRVLNVKIRKLKDTTIKLFN